MEEDKKQKKKERDVQRMREYRQKRQEYVKTLEQKVEALEKENSLLRDRIKELDAMHGEQTDFSEIESLKSDLHRTEEANLEWWSSIRKNDAMEKNSMQIQGEYLMAMGGNFGIERKKLIKKVFREMLEVLIPKGERILLYSYRHQL